MKLNDPVIYQGREYVIDKFKAVTIIIRPKHATIAGECIEITPDRLLPVRRGLRFTDIQEVHND